MANHDYLFKTRPSHFVNVFYYLFMIAIFAALWMVKDGIGDVSVWVMYHANSLALQKSDEFVIGSSTVLENVILMLPILFAAYRYLKTELNHYYFCNDRIVFYYGLINRHKDNVEYYRVRDHYSSRPLHLRLLGLSVFNIISTDRRFPKLVMKGFIGISGFETEFRNLVEQSKESGKGRELDVV